MAARAGLASVMKAAAAKKKEVTEEELRGKSAITPEDVLALAKPCQGYLCKITDNVYGIDFTAFKLRELEHGTTLFEVAKPADSVYEPPTEGDDDSSRFVRYELPPAFLKLTGVGATVTFRVGSKPVGNFRMIERHFFKDRLLKSFDFSFGFCMPNSTNTCEHMYDLPALSDSEIAEMIAGHYETRSDSFYFVDGKLVMHHRADYNYDN
eukprot:m.223462 g.223462  ORF g.223462 m.223462 type:complete len:209 (+) comp16254_c0_seq1:90-716(+)